MSDGKVRIRIDVKGEKDIDRARGSLLGLEGAAESTGQKLMGFAKAIGVMKLLNGAFNMIKNSLSTAFRRIDTMEQFDRVMTTITGSSQEAARALEATNESVLGTAYGLDVAAQAVQNFVTRGMKVDDATATIAAWGDAVAFYGDGSNQQLQSVSDALSKMVTKGKVEMDQMNRLFDAGIPVVDIYADKVGMSTEEVQNQLSSGKISAEEFVSVMNEALMEGTEGFASIEGAAKEAGATWGATFDNMKAAVARGVVSIIESIDELLEDNGLPTMRGMVSDFGSHFEDILKKVAEQVGNLGQPFIDLLSTIKSVFSGDMGGVQEVVQSIVPRMVEWIQQELPMLLKSGLEMVRHLAVGISESSIGLKETGLELLGVFVSGVMEALPMLLETGFQIIGTLMTSFIERYPDVLASAGAIVMTIVEGILTSLPDVIESGVTLIDSWVEGIVMNLPAIVDTALDIVTTFLSVVIENLPAILDSGIDLLFSLVDGIISVLPEVGEAALNIVSTLLEFIVQELPGVVNTGVTMLVKLVEGIASRLPEVVKIAMDILAEFLRIIIASLPDVIVAGVDILLSLIDGIFSVFRDLTTAVNEATSIISDTFSEISLVDIGKNIIRGLWGGMNSMRSWVSGKIGGFVNNIIGWFKNPLGIKSPSTLFRDEIGKMIPAGLEIGIKSGESSAKQSAERLVDGVLSPLDYKNQIQSMITPSLPKLTPTTVSNVTTNSTVNNMSNKGNVDEIRDVVLTAAQWIVQRPISVQINGHEIVRATVDDMSKELAWKIEQEKAMNGISSARYY